MAKKKEMQPQWLPSPLKNNMTNYNVYYMSAVQKVLFFCLTFIAGGLAGLVFYGGLFKVDGEQTIATFISNTVVFVIVGGIAAKVFMPVIRNLLKEKRDKALQKQFLNLLESLSASLSAGNTVADAFTNAYRDLKNQYLERNDIIKELAEILAGVQNGLTLEEMILDFGLRSNNEDIQNFSNVISNCYRLGGDFNNVVRKTRRIISDKVAISDEIATKVASNKLQHTAMSVMPIALVALLKLSSSSFAENLATATGVIVTTIAIAIFIGSFSWGRKILKIR